MKSIQEKIESIQINGYTLNFETTFEFALENYKKIAVYAGLLLLVFIILFSFLFMGILSSFCDLKTILFYLNQMSVNPESLSLNFLMGYYGIVILVTCILSPFQAGFLKMADSGQKGEAFHVSTIFEYYKLPYFTSIVLATLLITLPGMAISILLESYGIKYLGTMPSLLISFLTFLTIPLIVFGKLNTFEAIKTSFTIMSKNVFVLLGLLFVSVLLALVGIIGCGIGLVFTLPFIYSMTYAIYTMVIGFEFEESIENADSLE